MSGRSYLVGILGYHVAVWIFLISPHAFSTIYIAHHHSVPIYILNLLALDGALIGSLYFNLFFLIPLCFAKRNYVIYFVSLLLLFSIYMIYCGMIEDYVVQLIRVGEPASKWDYLFYFFKIGLCTIISFLLYVLHEKFEQQKQMSAVKLEKLQTEISYLRAQINPHFLFNTLNNLYALSIEKNSKTPGLILGLSRMMDYMIFESDDAHVFLQRDVDNLHDFIELEQIRQGHVAQITFSCTGVNSDQKIVPLLFLPLVENAFKHGINNLTGKSYLNISLAVNARQVSFRITNNYIHQQAAANSRGVGLINLKKRLELFYRDAYSFIIHSDNGIYEVELKLTLPSGN